MMIRRGDDGNTENAEVVVGSISTSTVTMHDNRSSNDGEMIAIIWMTFLLLHKRENGWLR